MDRHNQLRQGTLNLEGSNKTKRWSVRLFSTVIGMCITDAFRAVKHFHPHHKQLEFQKFYGVLAKELVEHANAEIQRDADPANQASDSTDAICYMQSLQKHPFYIAKRDSWEQGRPWHAPKLTCSICKERCRHYCASCSSASATSKQGIVAVCSNPHHARKCFTQHVLQTN